jgi:hypothetical protein
MPAFWIVRNVEPVNGLIRVHLAFNEAQQEDILLNVVPERFPDAFMEGDARGALFPLLGRAGMNGPKR